MVKATQNLSELHLTNSNDDSGCRSSLVTNNNNNASHRSKTGNKNSFKLLDVALSDVNLAKVECVFENDDGDDGDHLLVRTNHHLPIQSNVCISISPPLLTTSKSENNIFEKNLPNENPSHFNVVSLSDLSDDAAQYYSAAAESEHHFMNDLSKTQVLNQLSDDKINGKMNRF